MKRQNYHFCFFFFIYLFSLVTLLLSLFVFSFFIINLSLSFFSTNYFFSCNCYYHSYYKYYNLIMDPALRLNAFSTRWRARLLFWKWIFYWLRKWLGIATYFCFIFKRVNKIKKKNPKCDSLFWKRWSAKNRIGFGGQVTYREGTVKTVTPL